MNFLPELTKEQKVSKIKIFVGDKLIGQVIGPDYDYVKKLWSNWAKLRYSRHKSLGYAIIMRRNK
jgi:hypothetical protein